MFDMVFNQTTMIHSKALKFFNLTGFGVSRCIASCQQHAQGASSFSRIWSADKKDDTSPNVHMKDMELGQAAEKLQKDYISSQRKQTLPVIVSRELKQLPLFEKPRQAWLETLSSIEDIKLGLIGLHPDVFATFPRLDLLHRCVVWQRKYKTFNLEVRKTRAEMRGGGRKPWRQKGTGRARHGSIRSPIWKGGGSAKGPRGPISYWYVLPTRVRERALRVALTTKYVQDNLHIVDSLEIPTSNPEYLDDVAGKRYWGSSVLFVDHKPLEDMPLNFVEAVNRIRTYNVMPTEGLNVYSMLKHETLVLTLDAVEFLEERLLYHMHRHTGPLKADAIMSQQLNRIPVFNRHSNQS